MDTTLAVAKLSQVESMRAVLQDCFDNDPGRMRAAAKHFAVHGRPPTDLGKPYRDALGSRPRAKWWKSVLSKLEGLDQSMAEKQTDVDSISGLNAAWNEVKHGRHVVLRQAGKVFARVIPI